MPTLGETPVPLILTRDQVRLVRGMIATTAIQGELIPCFQELKDILDLAETQATIASVNPCPFTQSHTRAWCGYDNCREN
jgi:hypothetical protein